MDSLFPNGVAGYAIGGALIGLSVAAVYYLTGRIAGISSILTALQSYWSRRAFFKQDWVLSDRAWKGVLVLGLLLGAAIYALTSGGWYVTTVQPWRLFAGGLFVGYGTRLARGCTSGHGICGLSATSLPSLVSTVTFLGTAIVVAHITAAAGVTP